MDYYNKDEFESKIREIDQKIEEKESIRGKIDLYQWRKEWCAKVLQQPKLSSDYEQLVFSKLFESERKLSKFNAEIKQIEAKERAKIKAEERARLRIGQKSDLKEQWEGGKEKIKGFFKIPTIQSKEKVIPYSDAQSESILNPIARLINEIPSKLDILEENSPFFPVITEDEMESEIELEEEENDGDTGVSINPVSDITSLQSVEITDFNPDESPILKNIDIKENTIPKENGIEKPSSQVKPEKLVKSIYIELAQLQKRIKLNQKDNQYVLNQETFTLQIYPKEYPSGFFSDIQKDIHCVIEQNDDGTYILKDPNNRQGTYFNKQFVKADGLPIKNGDIFILPVMSNGKKSSLKVVFKIV